MHHSFAVVFFFGFTIKVPVFFNKELSDKSYCGLMICLL